MINIDANVEELQQLDQTLQQLQRNSRGSLFMVLLGAAALLGSLWYSATRLEPLERQIEEKKQQIGTFNQQLAEMELASVALQQQITQAEQQLIALKSNIEQLYAVKVTAENQVFELKATARATGRQIAQGPEYAFTLFINASASTIAGIAQVSYLFEHPSFRQKLQTSRQQADNFSVGYSGWGCLTQVTATVTHQNNSQQQLKFNMCQSLGPQWLGQGCKAGNTVPEKISKQQMAQQDCPVRWSN